MVDSCIFCGGAQPQNRRHSRRLFSSSSSSSSTLHTDEGDLFHILVVMIVKKVPQDK